MDRGIGTMHWDVIRAGESSTVALDLGCSKCGDLKKKLPPLFDQLFS